jgi:hypothetical protein
MPSILNTESFIPVIKVNGQVLKVAVKLNWLGIIALGKLKMQFLQVP